MKPQPPRPRLVSEIRLRSLGFALAPVFVLSCAAQASQHRHVARHSQHLRAAAASEGVVTYNKDSRDPNIGWHDDGHGMRVCTQDCDNPEIPGSGYACRNVQVMARPGASATGRAAAVAAL